MGYPEEESDNKKVETHKIFLDEFAKESEKVNNLTSNDSLHFENLAINGYHPDTEDKNIPSTILPAAVELNFVNINAVYDKNEFDDKSLGSVSRTKPVDNGEFLDCFSQYENVTNCVINSNCSDGASTCKSVNIDKNNDNSKEVIGFSIISPTCNSKSGCYSDTTPKQNENKICAELTIEPDVTNSMSSLCDELNSISVNPKPQTSIINLTETSEVKDEDSNSQCIKISNVVSLKKSVSNQLSKAPLDCDPNAKTNQDYANEVLVKLPHLSSVATSPKGSFADAFFNFVSNELPKTSNDETDTVNENNQLVLKSNFKKCKRKFCRKKLFNSKEIALMRGFYIRSKSISLFNGKFLTRGCVNGDQLRKGQLELSNGKPKFISSNNNTSLKQIKRGRGRPRKVLDRVGEKFKPKSKIKPLPNSFPENLTMTTAKNSPILGNNVKKNNNVFKPSKNTKTKNARRKNITINLPNTFIDKNIIAIENDKDSISSIDDVNSSFLDIKDGEKLYSKLIEEAMVTDFDSTSEKSFIRSDNELADSLGEGTDSVTETDMENTILKNFSDKNSNIFDSKSVLQRHLSARRRSPSRSNVIKDIEVEDQCCGHWFPTRKSYISHLIEMEADSLHTAKLLDNEMIKCPFCPTWTTVNGEKRHLRESHNSKYHCTKNYSSVACSLKAKVLSKCLIDSSKSISTPNCKVMKMKDSDTLTNGDKEKIAVSVVRPCPMSKKLDSLTNTSKEIICNLTDDPMASDSVIKIVSVSELPNHLKPVIQLSLKENIEKKNSYNSTSQDDLNCKICVPAKPLSGHFNNSTNVRIENDKLKTAINIDLRKPSRNSKNNVIRNENNLTPLINKTLQMGNGQLAFSTKDENSPNISRGRRFSSENNNSLKKRMRRRRRSSRLSLDCSPERIVRNGSVSRIKFRAKLKRNRTLRHNGRKIRRCGFHSSETSDGTSTQSESDSSESHESEFLDYDVNDNIENIPTVELDLFTIDSFNEEPCLFLTDPSNPNFKVYASMDAIFVGDSALGDVTNQVGYVTDVNNVVYVNPSHFLFPKIDDNDLSNIRLGNSKMKRSAQNIRKAIKPLKEELRNVKVAKSNSKVKKVNEDILAIATENIKGYDKENLTTIDNNITGKFKVTSLQHGDGCEKAISLKSAKGNIGTEESSKISSSSSGILHDFLPVKSCLDDLSPIIETSLNKSVEHLDHITNSIEDLSSPKSTIVVRSDVSKRKVVLKNTINTAMSANQNVIVIKTSTNRVNVENNEIPRFKEPNKSKLSEFISSKKSIASFIDDVHVLKEPKKTSSCENHDANSNNKVYISPNLEHNLKEPNTLGFSNSKYTRENQVEKVFSLKDNDVSGQKSSPKSMETDLISLDKEATDVFDGNQYLNKSFSNCVENTITGKKMDGDISFDNALASLDELIYSKNSDHALSVRHIYQKDDFISLNEKSLFTDDVNEIKKEPTIRSNYKKNKKNSPVKTTTTAVNNANGIKKPMCTKSSSVINNYQKDDIISLDDAIAALVPLECDKIEECMASDNKNKIGTVDIADFDAIAVSSSHNSDFTILNPSVNSGNAVSTAKPLPSTNECNWSMPALNSNDSKSLPYLIGSKLEYKSKEQRSISDGSLANQSLPQIEVGDSQVVVASAEITPFETLEGGVCLEDVLEKDAADFDTLSMNGFIINKENSEAQLQHVQNIGLSSVNSHIGNNSFLSTELCPSPTTVDSSSEKDDTKDNSFSSLTESFLNSTFDDFETSLEPVALSSSKYSSNFSIADIVKGKNLWDTPLLCSPIRSNLSKAHIPTTPNTPSRLFSRNKLDQLLDVPLSSIPDLLSPSRDLADKFMENGPVELSPNTVSSILSPNICHKNSDMLSPIVDSTVIERKARAPTNLDGTPSKHFKMKKKSVKKNILYSPKNFDYDSGINLKEESRIGLNQNSLHFSSTPKTESRTNLYKNYGNVNLGDDILTDNLTVSRLSPKKCSSKFSLNDTLSSYKSASVKNYDLLSTDSSISKSLTPKAANFLASNTSSSNSSPLKIGFLVNNSPLCKSSEKKSANYISHNSPPSDTSMDMTSDLLLCDSPSNSSLKVFPGFQPSDPSPSKFSLETFSGLLSKELPLDTTNSSLDKSINENLKLSSSKKSQKSKSLFKGFDGQVFKPRSPKLSDRSNTSLRMKISLKGFNNSKSEASLNNVSDAFFTDDDDDRDRTDYQDKSSSSSCSDSSSSSSNSGSSSSSEDSEDSSDENADELTKIVLTQFDNVSGRRKKTPSRPVRTPNVSSQTNESAELNLNKNTDLTSLKITVREADIVGTKCLENTPSEASLDRSNKDINDASSVITNNKQLEFLNLNAVDEVIDHLSEQPKLNGKTGNIAAINFKYGQEVKKDRIWRSREAKLKAQVMISDHQKGISDTCVGSTHLKGIDVPNNSNALSPKLDLSNALSVFNASKFENLPKLQGTKSENKDIRSYFTQVPVDNHPKSLSSKPESREIPMYTTNMLVSRTMKSPRNTSVSYRKTKKRKRSEDNIDIRTFLSPPELKVKKSVDVTLHPAKKLCLDANLSKLPCRTVLRNKGKLCASEIYQKYEEIIQNSLNNSDDVLTPQDLTFEGFEQTSRISSIRSKILLEYSDVLKMTWWFVRDRYPMPIDQLCDWDEDQLNSILFENG